MDYIVHYGIRGQKWGVRRFQNLDRTWTAAGKKRYGDTKSSSEMRVKIENAKKAVKGSSGQTKKEAKADLKYYKEKNKNEQLYRNLNKNKELSKHESNLIEHYKEKGMSDKEAAIAARKRIKVERAMAVTAGVGIASAAAYVAYKKYDYETDKIIPKDAKFYRVASNKNGSIRDGIYAVTSKADADQYVGLYGTKASKENGKRYAKTMYQKTLNVDSPLRVMSDKKAKDTLSDMVKSDPEYAKTLRTQIARSVGKGTTPKHEKMFKQALKDLDNGHVSKNVYDSLNWNLMYGINGTDDTAKTTRNRFIDEVTKRGYDAVRDINDREYSGYKTRTPTIVTNASKLSDYSTRELSKAEMATKAAVTGAGVGVKNAVPYSPIAVAGAGSAVGISAAARNKIVSDYRKEHPKTRYSDAQIVRMYEKQKLRK